MGPACMQIALKARPYLYLEPDSDIMNMAHVMDDISHDDIIYADKGHG